MPHPPGPALGRLLSLVEGPWISISHGTLALIPYWELAFARGDLWFRPHQASYGHSRPPCPQGWEGNPETLGIQTREGPLEAGPSGPQGAASPEMRGHSQRSG